MTKDAHDSREIKREESTRSLQDKWRMIGDVIMCDPELSAGAKCVAARLMWHLNCRWETCWPSQRTLAADLGMSPTTVLAAIKQLVVAGYVLVQKREDTSSLYRFDWSKLPDSEVEPKQDPAPISGRPPAPETGAKHGNLLTQEDSLSSSAAPQKKGGSKGSKTPRPSKWTDKPVAERMGRDGILVDENGDHDWLSMIFQVHLVRLIDIARANADKPVSVGNLRGRLGKLIKAEGPKRVAELCAQAIHAQPGGDPIDYIDGISRGGISRAETERRKTIDPLKVEEERAAALRYQKIDH